MLKHPKFNEAKIHKALEVMSTDKWLSTYKICVLGSKIGGYKSPDIIKCVLLQLEKEGLIKLDKRKRGDYWRKR